METSLYDNGFVYDNSHRHERVKLLATYFCPISVYYYSQKKVKQKVLVNLMPAKPVFLVKNSNRTYINFSKVKA